MGRLATGTPAGVYNSGNALFFGSKIQIQNFLGTPWGPQVPNFCVYSALRVICYSIATMNPIEHPSRVCFTENIFLGEKMVQN